MHDVGCPEPAAVVAIIDSTLSRFALVLMSSIVEFGGAATVVVLITIPLKDHRRVA
jgi:hypothetical protein